jgi:uncharacterized protein (TIGR02466 family)
MNDKVQILFPDHFYIDGPYNLLPQEKEFILNSKENVFSNLGGNFTSTNNQILENDCLKKLKSYFEQCINEYAYDGMKINKETEFYITQSWINFNSKGQSHHTHQHSNSIISGVFYVEGNDDCPINFHRDAARPYFGGNYEYKLDEYNYFNSKMWMVPNKKHHLILFPSTTLHSVENNNSDIERISLSFNTFMKGTVGNKNGLSELKL